MLRYLSPGDLLSDAAGLTNDDNRVIFRMFINTMVWGAIGTGMMLWLFA
ncbi:MAG: hypothetical protein JXQ99_02600 [Hyphomicrobiaceae bacterium]